MWLNIISFSRFHGKVQSSCLVDFVNFYEEDVHFLIKGDRNFQDPFFQKSFSYSLVLWCLVVYPRHDRVCLEISVKRDKLERSLTEGPFNEILTDRRKVGKSRPGIVYFSTEPEKFRPISDVWTVHLVHFYPERDESLKVSFRYRSFFNGNGKKIVDFWGWTVLPGKIRSHSAQVCWHLTEQIPFTYRHFWECLAGIALRIFLNETGVIF